MIDDEKRKIQAIQLEFNNTNRKFRKNSSFAKINLSVVFEQFRVCRHWQQKKFLRCNNYFENYSRFENATKTAF